MLFGEAGGLGAIVDINNADGIVIEGRTDVLLASHTNSRSKV